MTLSSSAQRPVALVLGVANQRSIAWACIDKLIHYSNLDCVVTFQNERVEKSVSQKLSNQYQDRIIGSCICNVEDTSALPRLFQEELPLLLQDRPLLSIVHSIAYANLQSSPTLLKATLQDFQQAQHISAFSFLQTVQYAMPLLNKTTTNISPSITTLSYIGAHRHMPGYSIMGPAKASLESLVIGLAGECGPKVRVNAVSAGPIQTVSARGIPKFTQLQNQVANASLLQRSVTADEVANTVAFLATQGTGITGQVIYVDAGYSASSAIPNV